ncbi:putative pantothenate transporter liz1 protein [Neofusicoccum parvum UCRNP2]|uniref:Putative pantothenate transporter liz1 protein n=1 Tax=Botryosphaeria parva (strain UCR-NP2) TaxID=1287680 RepID=R1H267_BOTPV|nr:putative pantothenate transporter liz1 protein [Neofusicoccum parvum UCRNP2]
MAPPHESVQKEPLDADVEMIENAKDTSGPELPPLLQGLAEDEIKTVEKKMIRKVDWRMLPLIILMYILNYLDRNNIAAARLAGLEDDLHLTGSQYQTAVSILFVGYVLMQGLPNLPNTTSWLSEQERQLALWRLEQDIGEDDQAQSEDESLLRGFKLALTDVKVYVVALILICIASSASVLNFFPTVVETLGYGSTETLLLTAPPYILCMITAYLVSWSSDRAGERYFHVTAPLYVAIVAFILAASTTATTPRYIAMVLMIPGFWSSWSLVFAWTSSSIPRPASKRAAALAMVNAVANSANIFGSFMYPKSQAPRYGELGLLAPPALRE